MAIYYNLVFNVPHPDKPARITGLYPIAIYFDFWNSWPIPVCVWKMAWRSHDLKPTQKAFTHFMHHCWCSLTKGWWGGSWGRVATIALDYELWSSLRLSALCELHVACQLPKSIFAGGGESSTVLICWFLQSPFDYWVFIFPSCWVHWETQSGSSHTTFSCIACVPVLLLIFWLSMFYNHPAWVILACWLLWNDLTESSAFPCTGAGIKFSYVCDLLDYLCIRSSGHYVGIMLWCM